MSAPHPTLRRRLLAALAALAPWLLRPLLAGLRASLRVDEHGGAALRARWARGEPVILAYWHNRQLMLPLIAEGQRVTVLISQHRDGDIGAKLVTAWGVAVVRGSATRGGATGMLRLLRALQAGSSLAVAPDGPRGPCYDAKPGIVHLARLGGAPVVPITYAADRAWRLGGWDRLVLPRPFASVTLEIGAPIEVPPDAGEADVERLRLEIEAGLRAVTAAAEARVGWPADARLVTGERS